jgi:hypothetical protein
LEFCLPVSLLDKKQRGFYGQAFGPKIKSTQPGLMIVRPKFRRRRVHGRSAAATEITHRAIRSNEKRIFAAAKEKALVGLIAKRYRN